MLEDLGHAGALCGIARFTGNQQCDPAELLRAPDPPKRIEHTPIPQILEDLGHAGALCGIVRFTEKHVFDPAEFIRVPDPPKRAERTPVLAV